MISLYESKSVINVRNDWIIKNNRIVIMWKMTFTHFMMNPSTNLMLFLLY